MYGDAELVDAPAQIPPGTYQATYLYHETGYFRSTPKVYVHMRIQGGEHDGVKLYRAFRVAKLAGKPKRNGGIKLHHSHLLYRQLAMLSGEVTRPDRVSLAALRNCLLSISVRTVSRDAGASNRKPRALPKPLQYSVIDELLAIDAGALKQ